jgi:single-strand DNA-binding protein
MATDNLVVLVGNLAGDPEQRETKTGIPVVSIRIAVNRRFFNKATDRWDEQLDGFFTCNVWNEQALNVVGSLTKGDRVLVTGRLRSRSYEKEGVTKWVTEVEADEVCPTLRWAKAVPERAARHRPEDAPPPEAPGGVPVPDVPVEAAEEATDEALAGAGTPF